MSRFSFSIVCALGLSALIAGSAAAGPHSIAEHLNRDRPLGSREAAPQAASLLFVENVGQFDPSARFQARAGKAVLWLADDALWVTVLKPNPPATGLKPGAG